MKLWMKVAVVLCVTAWSVSGAQAQVRIIGTRVTGDDPVVLAGFYEKVFGMKVINQIGAPPAEVILNVGATLEAAKANTGPQFVVARRVPGEKPAAVAHSILHVPDLNASIGALKAAGVSLKGEIITVPSLGGIKVVFFNDPAGNLMEIIELKKGMINVPVP
ncbi:MAG: VOC family protein [Steroidobacteraceae bacterium]